MKRNKKRFAAILAAMIVAASATTTAFAATANLSSVLELAIRASATALTISEVAPQSTPAATPSAPAASAAPSTPATPPATPATPSTPATSGYIGEAKAKQIAMNHAGVSNPNFVQAKLDYENGVVVYDVEFYSGNKEYDYEINATTGAIVSFDYDIENYVIPGGTTPTTPPATPATPSTPATSGYIGEAKAKQIAMNHAGVSNPNFVQAKMDYEHGIAVYDVEFYSGNKEYDYEINATTGAIVSYDYDIENYAIPGGTTTTTAPSASGTISAERAKQIALSHAGVSASNAYAMKVGMDYEHGVQIYEIDFKSGYMEYEYDINAQTGAILKAESDYDD